MSEKTELFGNFSEEAIAEGIEKLVDQKVKKLWGDSTTRTERFKSKNQHDLESKAQAVIDAWDGCGRYPDSSGDREHLDKAIEDLRESLNRE